MADPKKPKKRLRSNVDDFKDIKWKRKTGNPIIDEAIIGDGLEATIKFKDQTYEIISPLRKTIKTLKKFIALEDGRELTPYENVQMDDAQELMIEHMIVGFVVDEHEDLADAEYDQLAGFCWRYYEFCKKKSMARTRDSS